MHRPMQRKSSSLDCADICMERRRTTMNMELLNQEIAKIEASIDAYDEVDSQVRTRVLILLQRQDLRRRQSSRCCS